MIHTTFYDYKIIVERRYYPLGVLHDAVPKRTTGAGSPVLANTNVAATNTAWRQILTDE